MAKRACWAGEEYQEGHIICKRCPFKRSCKSELERRKKAISKKR